MHRDKPNHLASINRKFIQAHIEQTVDAKHLQLSSDDFKHLLRHVIEDDYFSRAQVRDVARGDSPHDGVTISYRLEVTIPRDQVVEAYNAIIKEMDERT